MSWVPKASKYTSLGLGDLWSLKHTAPKGQDRWSISLHTRHYARFWGYREKWQHSPLSLVFHVCRPLPCSEGVPHCLSIFSTCQQILSPFPASPRKRDVCLSSCDLTNWVISPPLPGSSSCSRPCSAMSWPLWHAASPSVVPKVSQDCGVWYKHDGHGVFSYLSKLPRSISEKCSEGPKVRKIPQLVESWDLDFCHYHILRYLFACICRSLQKKH